MTKHHSQPQNKALPMPSKQERKPQIVEASGQASEIKSPQGGESTQRRQRVEAHRKCPLCHKNPDYGGVGIRTGWRQLDGPKHKIYYRCDACGSTWGAEVSSDSLNGLELTSKEIVDIKASPDAPKETGD